MGVKLDPATLVKKGGKVSLGNLTKADPRWRVGLGWDDSDVYGDIDVDLWLVGLADGDAKELVRYDENDETKTVTSDSGGLVYMGDARSGKKVLVGDDEKGNVDFVKLHAAGIDQVLVIASIYKPGNLTFDQVDNAYIRTFPLSALIEDPSDKNEPEKVDQSKVTAMQLTDQAKGARVVIFGWFQHEKNGDPTNWSFQNQPSSASSIEAALAPFGVS